MTSHFPPSFAGHRPRLSALRLLAVLVVLPAAAALSQEAAPSPAASPAIDGHRDTPLLPGGKWHVHDPDRPQPPVVTPGTFSTAEVPGKPPSDAVVLFDGRDVSAWRDGAGQPAAWKVEDGAMIESHGDIHTAREFGDVQVHVEFAEPTPPHGHGQERGNSGVFLQGQYELQVLDSYQSPTYPDGQAGAIYGQQPPLVNPARPPGEWQTYDIVFTVARFAEDGTLQTPAYETVFYNGVLVQNHVALIGPTVHAALAKPTRLPPTGPLKLQDHHNAVRYRNIWVRPLPPA